MKLAALLIELKKTRLETKRSQRVAKETEALARFVREESPAHAVIWAKAVIGFRLVFEGSGHYAEGLGCLRDVSQNYIGTRACVFASLWLTQTEAVQAKFAMGSDRTRENGVAVQAAMRAHRKALRACLELVETLLKDPPRLVAAVLDFTIDHSVEDFSATLKIAIANETYDLGEVDAAKQMLRRFVRDDDVDLRESAMSRLKTIEYFEAKSSPRLLPYKVYRFTEEDRKTKQ